MKVMWVECSDSCEIGFVGEENILTNNFIFPSLPQASTVHEGGIVGQQQVLHFLKMLRMQMVVLENMPHVDVVSYS